MMVKVNLHNIRMMNVDIPARYGDEETKIKFFNFLFKTGYLLTVFLENLEYI